MHKQIKKMEIQAAYKYLELELGASKEEIDAIFKEKSKVQHPDKGGSKEQMSKLNEARELATEYSTNKSLIKVVQEIAKADNKIIQRSMEIDKEVNSIYKRAKRRAGNKLKSMKDITGLLGLFSAIGTLIVSKILPIVDLPDNSIYPTVALVFTVTLAIYYLLFNNRIKTMEDNVEDFKDSLDEKEELYYLLQDLFRPKLGKWITKDELIDTMRDWTGIRSKTSYDSISTLLLSTSQEPRKIARLIGYNDFSKMLLLKGEQSKFIESKENTNDQGYQIKYKILEKPVHNRVDGSTSGR